MQIWTCQSCAAPLGFLPDRMALLALAPDGEHTFVALGSNDGARYRRCANGVEFEACNWLPRVWTLLLGPAGT